MPSTLGIQLLGGVSLTYDDRPLTTISSGRSQMLLAYLALQSGAALPRQRIAFHLWPDSGETQARANLRKALSSLRQGLPNADDYIGSDTKTLYWSSGADFTLDVAEFEAAVATAEKATDLRDQHTYLKQAIALYRGELLRDWDDEWILPERERLHRLQVRALERLVGLLEQQRDYPAAIACAQQLLRLDELNEATYAALMLLHGANGDRANALQVYHQCMTLLRKELGVEPSAATRKLYEQLLLEDEAREGSLSGDIGKDSASKDSQGKNLQGTVGAAMTQVVVLSLPPLVGRETEWETLQKWMKPLFQQKQKATPFGRRSRTAADMLLLMGEPGIGKTRLLEELSAAAQAGGARMLWGSSFAAEMMRPFGIWIDALRGAEIPASLDRSPELGCLLPELGQPAKAPADLGHLFDAVVQVLSQWSDRQPLLVLLDDIQWMDEASAALLHYAMRLLRAFPVLFACTARAGELEANAAIADVVRALRRERCLQTLEVQPLNQEQTADLIRSNQALPMVKLSLEIANRVFIDSGGNPLFALEIARSLARDRPAAGCNLEGLIGDRLQQLETAAREFLPWAAVLGRSFNPTTVAQIADYPPLELLTAIEQLEQQGLIRPSASAKDGMGYDFAHNIVRQVVYQQLSAPRRQLMHLQIANKLQHRLTQDDSVAGDVAYHAGLGGDRPLAASAALTAAERCLKLFAYREALELAHQGLQHCQPLEPAIRLPLQAKFLGICAIAGDSKHAELEEAIRGAIDEAKSLGLNEAEATAFESLVMLQFEHDNFAGVQKYSLQAAETSRFASPATTARMLAYSGSCLAEIGRNVGRAEALLYEAQTLAEQVGLELCDIVSGLGAIHRHRGRYDEARSQLQRAWQMVKAEQDHWRECSFLSYLAMTELEAGDPQAAVPYCEEMARVAQQMEGEGSEGAISAALQALARYQLQLPRAEQELEGAIALLHQLDAKRVQAYVLVGAGEVDLQSERVELALARAQTALKRAQAVNHPSEIALSGALLVRGLRRMNREKQAVEQFEALVNTLDYHDLNLPAQRAIAEVMQLRQATASQ